MQGTTVVEWTVCAETIALPTSVALLARVGDQVLHGLELGKPKPNIRRRPLTC